MSKKTTVISDNLKELFQDGGGVYESPLLEEEAMAGAEMMGEEEMLGMEGGEDELEAQIQEAIAFLSEQGFEVIPA